MASSHANRSEKRRLRAGAPDNTAPPVVESEKPQSKDARTPALHYSTDGKDRHPSGAGGFNNGLYGTGAGSNK